MNLILRRSDVDDDGASCYPTSTRTTFSSSSSCQTSTAQSGLSEAVRAINNLATARVRKVTPSLIDVTGLGRPRWNSMAKKRIFNSGRRRRRHYSLVGF